MMKKNGSLNFKSTEWKCVIHLALKKNIKNISYLTFLSSGVSAADGTVGYF